MPSTDKKRSSSAEARVAGITGGAGFTGLVLLLPDGFVRSVFLLLAPSITILFSAIWDKVTEEISAALKEFYLDHHTQKLESEITKVEARGGCAPEQVAQLKKMLSELEAYRTEMRLSRLRRLFSQSEEQKNS